MGIGTLGFLKGASKVGLDSIEAREEVERKLKAEETLARLRKKLEEEAKLKDVVKWDTEVRDGQVWKYGMNANGQRVDGAERPQTETERLEAERQSELDELELKGKRLSLDKTQADIDNTRDTIRSRKEGDTRQARVANEQAGYYSRGNRGTGGSTTSSIDSISLTDSPQLALSKAAEEVITVDPGISRLLGDYAIPAHLVEVIKKDAVGQALRDPNAKSPAARAQVASSIMRRSILEAGLRYPKENK